MQQSANMKAETVANKETSLSPVMVTSPKFSSSTAVGTVLKSFPVQGVQSRGFTKIQKITPKSVVLPSVVGSLPSIGLKSICLKNQIISTAPKVLSGNAADLKVIFSSKTSPQNCKGSNVKLKRKDKISKFFKEIKSIESNSQSENVFAVQLKSNSDIVSSTGTCNRVPLFPDKSIFEDKVIYPFFQQMMLDLNSLVPRPNWTVAINTWGLHGMYLCATKQIQVQRSVLFCSDGSVEVFICGTPLPSSHELWDKICHSVPVLDKNLFIPAALNIIQILHSLLICSGVQGKEHLWPDIQGAHVVQNYLGRKALQSVNCTMISKSPLCIACQRVRTRLTNEEQKSHRNSDQLSPHCPNVCMTKDELIKKLSCSNKEIRKLQKALTYYKKKESKHFKQVGKKKTSSGDGSSNSEDFEWPLKEDEPL